MSFRLVSGGMLMVKRKLNRTRKRDRYLESGVPAGMRMTTLPSLSAEEKHWAAVARLRRAEDNG
jgi:hypothetical protein